MHVACMYMSVYEGKDRYDWICMECVYRMKVSCVNEWMINPG